MAAFDNDPLALLVPAFAVSPVPNQPLGSGVTNPAPMISNEIPADGTTTPPPLALIEVLVN